MTFVNTSQIGLVLSKQAYDFFSVEFSFKCHDGEIIDKCVVFSIHMLNSHEKL